MEKILAGIEELSRELDGEFVKFNNDTTSLQDLENIHLKVESLFKEIHEDGVCRADIAALNQMGLTQIEEKYYTEYRSFTGMDVALEAEGGMNFMSIVIGGILAALVALLTFLVGKFLGWLLDSNDRLGSSSSSSQSGTKVKVSKKAEPLALSAELIKSFGGGGKSYRNVIALHNLGEDFYSGKVTRELVTLAMDHLKTLSRTIDDFKDANNLFDEVDKYADKLDVTKKEDLDNILASIGVSELTTDLIKDTYPILEKIMGEKLLLVPVADRNGDSSANGSLTAKSKRVCEFTGTEIFSDKLTNSHGKINLIMESDKVDSGISTKERNALKGTVKDLEGLIAKFEKTKDATTIPLGSKNYKRAMTVVVKRVISKELIHPTQYLNTLLGKVIMGITKAAIKYKGLQAKFHKQFGDVFSDSELIKIVNIIDKSKLSVDEKKDLIKRIGDTRGSEVADAANIIAGVLFELEKKGDEIKAKLKNIKFYTKVGADNMVMRNDELTSKLIEANK